MLSCLRPAPRLPLRRLFCRCSAPDIARYKDSFANRMAMAGLKPHHRIALGVSGGPDSMALCVLTAGWKTDASIRRDEATGFIEGLLGIVVDHQLRPESGEEASLVQGRVAKLGIRCEIACCDWPEGRPKLGHMQEMAREMRYQLLQNVCLKQNIGVLLIAHHEDDQAELFILRLSRNSGILGLAGMPFISQVFPTNLHHGGENSVNYGILQVRPMLEFSKDDMYTICQGGHQEWVEDPTNQSQLFARNRIRRSLRSLASCVFKSEMRTLISMCRLTRLFVEDVCWKLIKQSVTIMDHGYAIIDLEKLKPSNVEDLCLSRFVALILQFISQRHRPIRGSTSRLLLDYIRSAPCKTSLTAAGCYLCAAPQSKGTKILVCCSLDSPHSSKVKSSYMCTSEVWEPSVPTEADQIIMDAKSYSEHSIPEASDVSFLHVASSETLLDEAKKLNVISEFTFSSISLLQLQEARSFNAKTEIQPDGKSRYTMKFGSDSSISLRPGRTCHFMSRFLVTWGVKGNTEDSFLSLASDFKRNLEDQDVCCFWLDDTEKVVAIRHMVDADWLYLAKLSDRHALKDCRDHEHSSICNRLAVAKEVHCSSYMQLSAQRALQVLKLIPLPARRALPVIINPHGLLLSIPLIWRCKEDLQISCGTDTPFTLADLLHSFSLGDSQDASFGASRASASGVALIYALLLCSSQEYPLEEVTLHIFEICQE